MPTLQAGIAAAKAGQKDYARKVFQEILDQDCQNEMAWLWLATVVEKDQSVKCLENVLKINPNNYKAKIGLARLRSSSTFLSRNIASSKNSSIENSSIVFPIINLNKFTIGIFGGLVIATISVLVGVISWGQFTFIANPTSTIIQPTHTRLLPETETVGSSSSPTVPPVPPTNTPSPTLSLLITPGFKAGTPPPLSSIIGPPQIQTTPNSIINVPLDYPTIQEAIRAANDGAMILVASGTYTENIDFLGKAIILKSTEGPETTVIDGSHKRSVVTFNSGEKTSSVLEGFTIKHGEANEGGGINIQKSAPTILRNLITENRAKNRGGAGIKIFTGSPDVGSPVIQENVIIYNTMGGSSGGGGGIDVVGGNSIQILDNVIAYNSSWHGGGLNLWGGKPIVSGNIINNNVASQEGGGIRNSDADSLIVSNLIINNDALRGGSIYWLVPQNSQGPILLNNTIANNFGNQVAGIYAGGFQAKTKLINNIIIGAQGQGAVFCDDSRGELPIFEFNIIYNPEGPAFEGACINLIDSNGNLSVDPLFMNAKINDYRLQPNSPAIDSGDNNILGSINAILREDFTIVDGNEDGEPKIDMGVYEFLP